MEGRAGQGQRARERGLDGFGVRSTEYIAVLPHYLPSQLFCEVKH
jgi:hypothetical protein